ncbi:MAG TPA: hypothetical protein VLH36_02220, partial [Steroidobacteraceae bacterium]|nr:hypothetical protein [Steroidobacteraceae bacterium]
MLARSGRDLRAAEHPGDFIDSRVVFENVERRARRPARGALADANLVVCLRGDLRQVSHAQHLAGLGEGFELATDHFRHGATDAGVDLVENQAGQVCRVQRRYLQRETDARQLATGRHPGQWSRRLPGVGADEELDVVAAVLRALRRIAQLDAGCED